MTSLAQSFRSVVREEVSLEDHQHDPVTWEAVEAAIEECESFELKLAQCQTLSDVISEAEGVNRRIAESFESYGLEGFDFDLYPVASFTERPSNVNLQPSLESLDKYKKVLIAGGIAGVILLIRQFIKWLLGRDKDGDSSDLGGTASTAKDASKDSKDAVKDIDRRIRDLERAAKKADQTPPDPVFQEAAIPEPVQTSEEPQERPAPPPEPRQKYDAKKTYNDLIVLAPQGVVSDLLLNAFMRACPNDPSIKDVNVIQMMTSTGIYEKMDQWLDAFDKQSREVFGALDSSVYPLWTHKGPFDPGLPKITYYFLHPWGTPTDSESKDTVNRIKEIREDYQREIEAITFEPGVEDSIFLKHMSPTYANSPGPYDSQVIVQESLNSIKRVADFRVKSYSGKVEMYNKELETIQKFLEKAEKGDLDVEGRATAIGNVREYVKYWIGEHAAIVKRMQQLNTTVTQYKAMINRLIPTYNDEVEKYVKDKFDRFAADDPEKQKYITETLKALKI